MRFLIYLSVAFGLLIISQWNFTGWPTHNLKPTAIKPTTKSISSSSNSAKIKVPHSTRVKTLEKDPDSNTRKAINFYFNCEQNVCDLKDQDPREYEISRGKKILQLFKRLARSQRNNSDYYPKLVKRALNDQNPFVQQGALEILKDLPPNQQFLEPLVKSGLDSQSPKIAGQVFVELLKYRNEHNKTLLNHRILDLLKTGPLVSRETFIENFPAILDKETVHFFRSRIAEITDQRTRYRIEQLLSAAHEYI